MYWLVRIAVALVKVTARGPRSFRAGLPTAIAVASPVRAVFQQEERDVVVAAAAGVPVHGCHQRVQRPVVVGRGKRRGDLVLREEVSVLVAAFDQAVGVEQEPVTGPPARGERGEVIVWAQAQWQVGAVAGQRSQDAASVQQRRVMAAVDDGDLAAGGDLSQRRGGKVLFAQVRSDGPADFARHLAQRGHRGGALLERAQHVPGQRDRVQALAADVSDDHPDAVRGGDDRVQVPAGPGSGCGEARARSRLSCGSILELPPKISDGSRREPLNGRSCWSARLRDCDSRSLALAVACSSSISLSAVRSGGRRVWAGSGGVNAVSCPATAL